MRIAYDFAAAGKRTQLHKQSWPHPNLSSMSPECIENADPPDPPSHPSPPHLGWKDSWSSDFSMFLRLSGCWSKFDVRLRAFFWVPWRPEPRASMADCFFLDGSRPPIWETRLGGVAHNSFRWWCSVQGEIWRSKPGVQLLLKNKTIEHNYFRVPLTFPLVLEIIKTKTFFDFWKVEVSIY